MPNYRLNAETGRYKVKGNPVTLIHTLEYVKRRPLLWIVAFTTNFGPPFLGLILSGIPGFIVGLALAAICFFSGRHAVRRVIERRIR